MNAALTRVKVCGITNLHDAELAVRLGADAIGFIFCESPRRIAPQRAREIVRMLPPFVTAVGVFVNAPAAEVLKTAEEVGLGAVQLHGLESPESVDEISRSVKVIKAFRVQGPKTLAECEAYPSASAFLFDTYAAGRLGGTGLTFDWTILAGFRGAPVAGRPWILAGGLRPENVQEAVARCRPYGIDVSSGVEKEPGIKDPVKLEQFIMKARQIIP